MKCYVQVVSKRCFYGNYLREMTKIAGKSRKSHRNSVVRYTNIWDLVILDSYCNDAKNHVEHTE